MITKSRAVASLILAASLQFGMAQVGLFGSGSLAIGTDAPVFDLSGDYSFTQTYTATDGSSGDIVIVFTMSQDSHGRLSGSGSAILVQIGDSVVAASYRLSGRVTGGGGLVHRAIFTVNMNGNDVVAGILTQFHITANFNLAIERPDTNGVFQLVDDGSVFNANFQKLGSLKVFMTDISSPVPTDGTWTINTESINFGNRMTGTGSIALSNGRTLSMGLSGSNVPKQGVAKVHLSGKQTGQGSSVSFSVVPNSSTTPISLTGTVMGQSVRLSSTD